MFQTILIKNSSGDEYEKIIIVHSNLVLLNMKMKCYGIEKPFSTAPVLSLLLHPAQH